MPNNREKNYRIDTFYVLFSVCEVDKPLAGLMRAKSV